MKYEKVLQYVPKSHATFMLAGLLPHGSRFFIFIMWTSVHLLRTKST